MSLGNAARRAGARTRIKNRVAGFGGKQNDALQQPLIELRRVPASPLFGIANDPREVEHVPRHAAAGIGPLVARTLTRRLHTNSVGVENGVFVGQAPQRPVVVAEPIMVVLAKRKDLLAMLVPPIGVCPQEVPDYLAYQGGVLGVETHPNDGGRLSRKREQLPYPKLVIVLGHVVGMAVVPEPDVIRRVNKNARHWLRRVT